jgi:hypothetical protein
MNDIPKEEDKIVKSSTILVVRLSLTQVHAFSEIPSKNFLRIIG